MGGEGGGGGGGGGRQWEGGRVKGGGSTPDDAAGLSRIMLETSCRTACPSEADAPQARLTAPSALSLDSPDSSSHLGDSGNQAYAEDEDK